MVEYFLFDLTSAEMSREENMFSAFIRVIIPKNEKLFFSDFYQKTAQIF